MTKRDLNSEIEVKLIGTADAFVTIHHDLANPVHKIVVRERPWRVHTYYDTPRLDLFLSDCELRVRPAQDGYRRTLKKLVDLSEDGVFTRLEEEFFQEDAVPVLADIRDRLPAPLRKKDAPLHPLFRTEFKRSIFDVTWRDAVIECAVDEGRVVVIGPSEEVARPFTMLEMELKLGQATDMKIFSKKVQAHYGLKPQRLTKPELAVQLGYDTNAFPDPATVKKIARKLKMRLSCAS